MSHIRIDNRSFSHMGIPDQSEFAFGGNHPPFVRKEIARKIGITYEKKKGGLGAIVSIAVSIAIPAIAPAIASSIGLSGAVAGMIGSQAVGGAIASGLVGAGLGAASSLITKQKMGQAALMGLIGGGVGGYTQATKAAEAAAAAGTRPSTAADFFGANANGVQGAQGAQAANLGVQVPQAGAAGITAPGSAVAGVADDAFSFGLGAPQVGAAPVADIGSALSTAGTTATAPVAGLDQTGSFSMGLGAPQTAGVVTTPTAAQVASGVTPSPSVWESVKSAAGEAFKLPKDPKGIAELTQRAAGMLAGSALSDEGLSDEQRALVRAQAAELRQLQETNEGLFRQRLDEANNILGGAKYYDPNYFGLQAQQATTTAIGRQAQETVRNIDTRRAGLRDATARRYALEGATRGQTAYLQGADVAAQNRLRTTQAGLAALPTSGPAPFNTGSGNYQQLLQTAEEQRRKAQEDIGALFGNFTGNPASKSMG